MSGTEAASVFILSTPPRSCPRCAERSLDERRGRSATRSRAPSSRSRAATSDVRDGQIGAAEDAGPLRQPYPTLSGPRRELGCDEASAAEPEGEQVGHAEKRAHAADLDHVVGLAGNPWRRAPCRS